MASKTVTYKGTSILNTDDPAVGFDTNNSTQLYASLDPDNTSSQEMYAVNEHRAHETLNPIWNQVVYDLNFDITAGSSSIGHVTLQGITDMGDIINIMQHRYTADSSGTKTFDLLGSSCTSAVNNQQRGVGTAGTIQVTNPLKYENYEYAKLQSSWYDTAWTYRKAMPIKQTLGAQHGKSGHINDYYGVVVSVPYNAHMNADFNDIRFCAPDGQTICPHYFITNTASTSAVAIVMIPWGFLDRNREPNQINSSTGGTVLAHPLPSYLYMYYGNGSAASTSDITLGGNAFFSEEFTDNTLAQWTLSQPTNSTITQSGTTATIGVTALAAANTNPYMEVPLPLRAYGTESWECIIKYTGISPISSTRDDGPYIRIIGRNPGVDGVTDESTSYWDFRGKYSASGTAYNSTADGYWGYKYVNNGVDASTLQYSSPVMDGVTTGYIKLRRVKGVGDGSDKMIYYHSLTGTTWDYIGALLYTSPVFDTDTYLNLRIYYVNTTATTQGSFTMDNIMVYPICGAETEYVEDYFQDSNVAGKWIQFGASAAKYITETGNQIVMGNNAPGTTTVYTAPFETTNHYMLGIGAGALPTTTGGGRLNKGMPSTETAVYETEIYTITNQVGASYFREGGLFYTNDVSLGDNYGFMWGLRTVTGGTYTFSLTTWSPSGNPTVSTAQYGSWLPADFPIKLRIVVDHTQKKVFFDAKKSGEEWKRLITSTGVYNNTYLGSSTGTFGLFQRTSAAGTNTGYVAYNYVKSYNDQFVESSSAWRTEETYQSISPTTPDPDDLQLTYSLTIPNRNTPYIVTTKQYGTYDNNSKLMYLTDADIISLGPEGTDPYIAMRLEFEFTGNTGDTISLGNIRYIYEVI